MPAFFTPMCTHLSRTRAITLDVRTQMVEGRSRIRNCSRDIANLPKSII